MGSADAGMWAFSGCLAARVRLTGADPYVSCQANSACRAKVQKVDRLGGDVQKWLDESVMAQDTAETERDQTELGGEG
jgi:hypothetical protein